MGFPNAAMDVAANNAWIAEQTKKDPSGISKPQMMVTPQTTADEVRVAVREDGFVVCDYLVIRFSHLCASCAHVPPRSATLDKRE